MKLQILDARQLISRITWDSVKQTLILYTTKPHASDSYCNEMHWFVHSFFKNGGGPKDIALHIHLLDDIHDPLQRISKIELSPESVEDALVLRGAKVFENMEDPLRIQFVLTKSGEFSRTLFSIPAKENALYC